MITSSTCPSLTQTYLLCIVKLYRSFASLIIIMPTLVLHALLTDMNVEEDSNLSVSCGNGKLRQWLIDQIDSHGYSGLVWENDEKTIFRIPWKHAGKQDYNRDEDAALFKVRPRTLWPERSAIQNRSTS